MNSGVKKRALEVSIGALGGAGLFYASYALGNFLAPLRNTEGMERAYEHGQNQTH